MFYFYRITVYAKYNCQLVKKTFEILNTKPTGDTAIKRISKNIGGIYMNNMLEKALKFETKLKNIDRC